MKCPLCQTHSNHFETVAQRTYFFCPECDGIFLSRVYLPTAEAEKERYLQHQNCPENEGYVKFLKEIVDRIRQLGPEVSSILDYGCGHTPVLVDLLRQAGYQATGYDPLFFPEIRLPNLVDCVTTVEVVEHFFEPAKEVVSIKQLLRENGYWFIQTQLFHPEIDFKAWWYVQDFTHVFFYSMKTFRWICRRFHWLLLWTNEKDKILFKSAFSKVVV